MKWKILGLFKCLWCGKISSSRISRKFAASSLLIKVYFLLGFCLSLKHHIKYLADVCIHHITFSIVLLHQAITKCCFKTETNKILLRGIAPTRNAIIKLKFNKSEGGEIYFVYDVFSSTTVANWKKQQYKLCFALCTSEKLLFKVFLQPPLKTLPCLLLTA